MIAGTATDDEFGYWSEKAEEARAARPMSRQEFVGCLVLLDGRGLAITDMAQMVAAVKELFDRNEEDEERMTATKTLADLAKGDTFRRPNEDKVWAVLRVGKKQAECRDETGYTIWFPLWIEVTPTGDK